MKHLNRIIAAYTAMDQRRKDEMLRIMEMRAKKHPANPRAPLTLVVNNPR
jgi:hypothetical protein